MAGQAHPEGGPSGWPVPPPFPERRSSQMQATSPRPSPEGFPPISREGVTTLQANLGYRCNQRCSHCHVAAGPGRREQMGPEVLSDVVRFLWAREVQTLDLTGGAPELNPGFRWLVTRARALGVEVIDRCNLTVLEEPGQEGTGEFLAANGVRIIASLPCYEPETVDGQRGRGTHAKSLRVLARLNALGYGRSGTGLSLDLVYNPAGPSLPPAQGELEEKYRTELLARHGVTFNRLLVLANMPIARFASALDAAGTSQRYVELLRSSHRDENLQRVMCRRTLSVDWQGYAYDCDFNQVLGLPLRADGRERSRLRDLLQANLRHNPIHVSEHCYGCTAGHGSSCTGSLADAAPPRATRPGNLPSPRNEPRT